jgi:PAS domain S-box-containing protein
VLLTQIVQPLVAWLKRQPLTRKVVLVAGLVLVPLGMLGLGLVINAQPGLALLVLVCMLLAIYALAALGITLQHSVDSLATMTAQIAGGNRSPTNENPGDDEFGDIARLLQTIAVDAAMSDLYRRAIVDHAVDGIMIIDEYDTITTFNPAAERVFGYQADEIIGQPVARLIPDPLHRQYKLISLGDEVIGVSHDGRSFPMDLSSGQIMIDKRRLYVVIVRDATRRKQIEAELERARDDAEAANRAKSTFLANMSHELRTPLNAIIGYSDLLIESLEDEVDREALANDLQRINRSGQHLHGLISDILDISKIEAGKMELRPEPFHLKQLLQDIEATITPLAQQNGNRFTIDYAGDPDRIVADPVRIKQILINLLGNACKFTEQGSVALEVGITAQQTLRFVVRDTGIGMSDEQIMRLFEPFAQVDESSTRRYSGSGLGLAITRRFCEMMGGTVSVTSTPGAGSVFTVHLPLQRAEVALGVGE